MRVASLLELLGGVGRHVVYEEGSLSNAGGNKGRRRRCQAGLLVSSASEAIVLLEFLSKCGATYL